MGQSDPPIQGSTKESVREALKNGLPQTALAELEQLIPQSLERKDEDAAIWALAVRAKLQAQAEDEADAEQIIKFQSEIQSAPASMRPVMRALLAEWFFEYLRTNQWRLRDRTPIGGSIATDDEGLASVKSSVDLKTWDRQRFLQAAKSLFERSLSDAAILKTTSVENYQDVLTSGTVPKSYQPTLYDFIVGQAIKFHEETHETYAGPVERFELDASSPVFADLDQFLSWRLPEVDLSSPLRHATGLFQQWLSFHRNDTRLDARVDVDLQRLMFAREHAIGVESISNSLEALKRFSLTHADHPVAARAKFLIAEQALADNQPQLAHQIATAARDRHPDSYGGRQCDQLIRQIEVPSLTVATERVWSPGLDDDVKVDIAIDYKNLKKVYFRMVRIDLKRLIPTGKQFSELSTNDRLKWLEVKPTREWFVDLPATNDFQSRREVVHAPPDLERGAYALLACSNDQFDTEETQEGFLAIEEVWVSGLALVVRNRYADGSIDGLVLDNVTGQPLAGARVQVWGRAPRQESRTLLATLRSDDRGHFVFDKSDVRNLVMDVRKTGDRLISHGWLQSYRAETTNEPSMQSVFFTDRAIYRPGQTVRFKVISVLSDQSSNHYRVIPQRDLRIELRDVNHTVVAEQTLRTNELGSTSGSFNLPINGLAGSMTLQVAEGPYGQTSFSVEQYKRPKFEVKLEPPTHPVRLEQTVKLGGQAKAYSDAPIDGAIVRFGVVREVDLPIWWWWRCWWMPPSPPEPQTISIGQTTTDAQGRFEIEFDAVPDASVSRDSEPMFRYLVTADVIDPSGETRSDTFTVVAGYTTMTATLTTKQPDWLVAQEPVEFQIRTTSLQGQGVAASVKLELHSLQIPAKIGRDSLGLDTPFPAVGENELANQVRPGDPNSWPTKELISEETVVTAADGNATWSTNLKAGHYRATLHTFDAAGNAVTALCPLQVLNPDASTCRLSVPQVVAMPKRTWVPGEEFIAIWGSGYDRARAFIEIEHRGEVLQRYWTPAGQTQTKIKHRVDESMRGGFVVRVTMVRENRFYVNEQTIEVPWSDRELAIRWERFTNKLKPGSEETWTATVTPNPANSTLMDEKRMIEMVATLYDASLDAFLPHRWLTQFDMFYRDRSSVYSQFENGSLILNSNRRFRSPSFQGDPWLYRQYPPELRLTGNLRSRRAMPMMEMAAGSAMQNRMVPAAPAQALAIEADSMEFEDRAEAAGDKAGPPSKAARGDIDLGDVPLRENLNETAFFFPTMVAAADGSVSMTFTMPESLTRWRLLGFAHAKDLSSGAIEATTVTSKDLMVQPNPPRSLREGDQLEWTVKISNQSATHQTGVVSLAFEDARTGDSVNDLLGINEPRMPFAISSGQSQTVAWSIKIPDGMGLLVAKTVGSTGKLSDGEQGYVPVLSRRVLVHESLPLPVSGPETKTFHFESLEKSGGLESLKNESLTIQMTSNPAWYAVMSLPYLMQFPHKCSEQTFNRLYANLLARHIATSDPKIERVFEAWRNQPVVAGRETLASPLLQNESLGSILLAETPWVMDANSEGEARRNVGILFDQNRVAEQIRNLNDQINQSRLTDGSWAWFPGGPSNPFITLYITTGFGRLRQLGVDADLTAAIAALAHVDQFAVHEFNDIKDKDHGGNHLNPTIAFLLYGRSFFLNDQPMIASSRSVYDYWISQGEKYWMSLPSRMSQAHLAVALHRLGRTESATAIMKSLKELAVIDDSGMNWKDARRGWWWYEAGIESQTMMIEAFDEVSDDQASVELCQAWLLRQKETQSWDTTKSTADAIYALLLRGTDKLADNTLVDVAVGEAAVPKAAVEAGTGFYQHRVDGSQVDPSMGVITVTKTTPGIAWGAIHWQFFQSIEEVQPYEGTPLRLEKQLFVVRRTPTGQRLEPVDDGRSNGQPLAVGDELVSRLVLRTSKEMEFIHLCDHRGSGTEPTNVLSGYRFEDGLVAYQSTQDTAEHYFIDWLPVGTYVLESRCRVQLRGDYQSGIATVESMYAPQYNGHSESFRLVVE